MDVYQHKNILHAPLVTFGYAADETKYGPSKISGRQSLKKLKWYVLQTF